MIEITEKKEDSKEYYVRIDCKTDIPELLIDRTCYIYSGLFGESYAGYNDYSIHRFSIKYNNVEKSAEEYLTAIKDQYDKIEKLVPELGHYTLSKVCIMDSNHNIIYSIRKGDDGEIHVSESIKYEALDKGYITNEEADKEPMENMTVEQIELIAYKLIRREVNKFDRTTTDSELGNYVRGVVQMQTELYSLQVSQSR